MAEDQDQSSDKNMINLELSSLLENMLNSIARSEEKAQEILVGQRNNREALEQFRQVIEEKFHNMAAAYDKLRATMLGKQDQLQGAMDLLRIDLRSKWNTADFAILNSRSVREEHDKMLDMISTMQKQQQMLAAQVEELRKNALDKGQNGS